MIIKQNLFRKRTFKMYFASFMLPVVIMFVIIMMKHIYPFGDKCFLRSDLYNQYLPFFSELQRKLQNGENFHYSWKLGLGSNFMAIYAYYLASPLNFLVVFVPQRFLIEFMTLLIICKIGFCGFSFCYYFTKHFQCKKYSMVCFSLFYALSGYLAAYNWNIMWLDCIALAPLVIWGLENLVKNSKWKFYAVTLGLSIWMNYYISIMICFFLIIYFVILILYIPWKDKRRAFLQFAGSSILAAGFAAMVLIPGIVAIYGTGFSEFRFPDEMKNYFNLLDVIARHCINVSPELKNDHWPNIYCGVGVIFLLPFYMFCKQISWKEKIPRIILLLFFIISFSNNVLNFLWHGLNYPDSLPCRQSFLYILVLLTVCYEAFLHVKDSSVMQIIFSFTFSCLFLLLCYKFVDHEDFSNQAYLLTLVFICSYAVMGLCYRYDAVKFKLLTVVIMLLAIFEVGLNTYNTSVNTVTRSKYMNSYEKDEAVTKRLEALDDDFYRIEQSDRTTKNDGALAGFKTATIFSSTTNGNVIEFYKQMGMDFSKVYYNFDGATPLITALLSVRYLFTETTENWNDSFHTLLGNAENVSIYQNNALAVGYVIPTDLQDNWDNTAGDAITSQNNFVYALGSKEALFEKIQIENIASDDKSESFYIPEDGNYYIQIFGATSTFADEIEMTVQMGDESIRNQKTYKKVRKSYVLSSGRCKTGDLLTLTPTTGSIQELDVMIYKMNDSVLNEVIEKLKTEQLYDVGFGDDDLSGTINLAQEGQLVLSVPDEPGWTLYVDGKAHVKEQFANTFIAITLEAGTHDIRLEYLPAGTYIGFLITLFSILVFISIILHNKQVIKHE